MITCTIIHKNYSRVTRKNSWGWWELSSSFNSTQLNSVLKLSQNGNDSDSHKWSNSTTQLFACNLVGNQQNSIKCLALYHRSSCLFEASTLLLEPCFSSWNSAKERTSNTAEVGPTHQWNTQIPKVQQDFWMEALPCWMEEYWPWISVSFNLHYSSARTWTSCVNCCVSNDSSIVHNKTVVFGRQQLCWRGVPHIFGRVVV